MKHYRHIIWDWNGTLVDDVRVSVEVLQRCQDLGLTQSILSTYAQTLLEECVEFFGLRPPGAGIPG